MFSQSKIVAMEKQILESNITFMYPPTASCFALMFLNGCSGASNSIQALIDNIQFTVQLASCDFFFLHHTPSNVAIAAIVVAMEQMDECDESHHACILETIQNSRLELKSNDTIDCITHLKSIAEGNQLRIREIDDNSESATDKAAASCISTGRVTPSPTAELIVQFSGNKRSHDGRTR
jgi:hypothetical protein